MVIQGENNRNSLNCLKNLKNLKNPNDDDDNDNNNNSNNNNNSSSNNNNSSTSSSSNSNNNNNNTSNNNNNNTISSSNNNNNSISNNNNNSIWRLWQWSIIISRWSSGLLVIIGSGQSTTGRPQKLKRCTLPGCYFWAIHTQGWSNTCGTPKVCCVFLSNQQWQVFLVTAT